MTATPTELKPCSFCGGKNYEDACGCHAELLHMTSEVLDLLAGHKVAPMFFPETIRALLFKAACGELDKHIPEHKREEVKQRRLSELAALPSGGSERTAELKERVRRACFMAIEQAIVSNDEQMHEHGDEEAVVIDYTGICERVYSEFFESLPPIQEHAALPTEPTQESGKNG